MPQRQRKLRPDAEYHTIAMLMGAHYSHTHHVMWWDAPTHERNAIHGTGLWQYYDPDTLGHLGGISEIQHRHDMFAPCREK